ncbi:MAG: hypothetical protein ACP5UB_10055 [Candidatus Sumerlaeaceae bacterium]|jgi:hypothetical protein
MAEGYQRGEVGVLLAGVGVGLFVFSLYALLASDLHFGYEGEHAAQAKAWVEHTLTHDSLGRVQPRARGGLIDVGQYVPFYLVAQLAGSKETQPEIEQFWYIWVHPFWNAWTAVMIFYLAWTLCRQMGAAIACALLAATATVLFPYSKFGMETQQTLWATASWAALLLFHSQPTLRSAFVLGFTLAMVVLTKITGITVAAAGAAVLVWWLLRDESFSREVRRRPALLMPPLVGLLIGLGVLFSTNKLRYGAFTAARYPWGDRPDALPFTPERIWAFLASPNKSVFLFSPVLLITLPYWREFFSRHRQIIPIVVAAGALLAFHLSMNTWVDERWWFSRLHVLLPLLVLPLVVWWEKLRVQRPWQKALAVIIIVFACSVQLLGSAINYTALAYVVHPSNELTRENLVWNPQYNHLRFNLWALRSWWNRKLGGAPLCFEAYRHYLPAAPPPAAYPADRYAFKGYDEHDFFLFKAWAAPDVPLARSIARTAVGLSIAGMLLGAWCIVRATRKSANSRGLPTSESQRASQWAHGHLPSRKWP